MFFRKKLSKSHLKSFEDDGFVILKKIIKTSVINQMITEIEDVTYDQLKKNNLNNRKRSFKNLIKHAFKNKQSQIRFFLYHRLRSIPTLQSLCFSNDLTKILKKFGQEIPACVQKPTIRFDFSEENKHKLNAHQDIRAILCSKCITVWIPITSVNQKNGTIKLYKKSHNHGLLDHVLDRNNQVVIKNLNKLDKFNTETVQADPGDMIIMNSFCLHSSVKGQNNTLKLNIQAFYNDLKEINMHDKFYKLKNIPDAGKKTMYDEYK
tara:strand:+ start:8960 stop:9751 length:792 start_codon:yes stop_codon:yes gene_type:complete